MLSFRSYVKSKQPFQRLFRPFGPASRRKGAESNKVSFVTFYAKWLFVKIKLPIFIPTDPFPILKPNNSSIDVFV